jgi:hypothetical protein
MKKYSFLLTASLVLMLIVVSSCNSQQAKSEAGQTAEIQKTDDQTVTVYYFHGDRKCETCKAVGRVSKRTVKENFSDNQQVVFKDINIEAPENNEIKDQFELSGSGLFVYDGNTKIDLTAFAFQKAVGKPDELSDKIISTVKDMM